MTELLTVIPVILILVALNGLFVAAEFAIISVPRAAVSALAATGNRRAGQIQLVLENPALLDRYVATAQLGITFASLGLGMYGEHALADILESWLAGFGLEGLSLQLSTHGIAVALALAVVTYLHIVLGEMIPKALALTRSITIALWVTPPMRLVGLLAFPLVLTLNNTGNLLLRLVGVHRDISSQHYMAPEELELLARESQESGLLSEEIERIFSEIADFSEIDADEAMVPRVLTRGIPADVSVEDLRNILLEHRHTRYPVFEGDLDHITGTVHIKDLFKQLRNETDGGFSLPVREVAFLPETATLDDVLVAMERTRNQMVVIMDEHGGTAGILTMEDICVEAVGDIGEGEDDVYDILPMGLDSFQVQGAARLNMLGAVLERDLEHPEVDTVSGLILSELGRPPQVGDVVQWRDLRFEVSSIHGHGVRQTIVHSQPAQEDSTPEDKPQ